MGKPNARHLSFIALLLATLALSVSCPGTVLKSALSSIRDPARVEIRRQGDPFAAVLTRKGSAWFIVIDDIRAYPVNETHASTFMSLLAERQPIVRVGSGNAQNYGIGIAGSYAVSVEGERAIDGTERLFFGDVDATGEWQYFSREGDSAVYRVPSSIARFLGVKVSEWAELSPYRKTLASCDVQEITALGTAAGTVVRYRAGIDPEVAEFGIALGKLSAVDITNFPSIPTITVEVTFGNASQTVMDFTPIGEDWILADRKTGLSYVVSGSSKQELFSSLPD